MNVVAVAASCGNLTSIHNATDAPMTATLIFGGLYIIALIAIAVYLLMLATRLVKAQERSASALDDIARRLRDRFDL